MSEARPDQADTGERASAEPDGGGDDWRTFFDGVVTNDQRVTSLIEYDGVQLSTILTIAHEIVDASPLDVPKRFAALQQARTKRDQTVEQASSGVLELPIGLASMAALGVALIWLVIVVLHLFGTAGGARADVFGYGALALLGVTIGLAAAAAAIDSRRAKAAATPHKVVEAQSALLADQIEAALSEDIREQVVVPTLERASDVRFSAPGDDQLRLAGASSLSTRAEARDRIETESYRRLAINLNRTGGATVGLAGSRGAGKSELLRTFCDPEANGVGADVRTIAVALAAPVSVQPDVFARLLVRRLAESVPGYDTAAVGRPVRFWSGRDTAVAVTIAVLGIASVALLGGPHVLNRRFAGYTLLVVAGLVAVVWGLMKGSWLLRATRDRGLPISREGRDERVRRLTATERDQMARRAVDTVRRLRYAETRSVSGEASASIKAVGAKITHGRSLSELPLSEADVLAEFEDLVRDLNRAYPRVVIGIDELDKLGTGEDAERFLNGIKAFLSVPNCSFVLTVSDNAFAQFARRGTPIRDVFDSSLDAVIWVKPMSFPEARRLTRARLQTAPSERMSDVQIMLSYVLSGGLPRDFLRYARQIGELGTTTGTQRLGDLLSQLIDEEVRSRVSGNRAAIAGRDGAGQTGPWMAELEMLDRVDLAVQADRRLREFLSGDPTFTQLSSRFEPPVATAASAGTDDAGAWYADIRRQLYAYLYFADTVRLGFNTWSRFADTAATITAFDLLATARQRLEIDPAIGWRATSEARRKLGLTAIDPSPARSKVTVSAAADPR